MDAFTPYFITRSTSQNPREYGARLTRCDQYLETRPSTYEKMLLDTDGNWQQAHEVVAKAFGFREADQLLPAGGTKCLYALEHGSWSDKHQSHGDDLAVCYRVPASHPDHDEWELMAIETVTRVIHKKECYFVAKLEEQAAYLIVPEEVAKKSLQSVAFLTLSEEEEEEEREQEVGLHCLLQYTLYWCWLTMQTSVCRPSPSPTE